MPRYFFVLPDVDKPAGGNAVAMQMAQILHAEGYDAGVVNGTEHYQDGFFEGTLQPYFYPPLAKIPRHFMSRRQKMYQIIRNFFKRTSKGTNPRLHVQSDDVFIIPELWYPEYANLFLNNKRILFSQATLIFCQALCRDIKENTQFLGSFKAIITVSDATQATVKQFAKQDSFLVSQSVIRPSLKSDARKKRQIAYMPRKRPREVDVLVSCLKEDPIFNGWEFYSIENIPRNDVDRILSESLIFLSFASNPEGFGLPPAEAMAAGCVVIGYTGVGGEEFFHSDTGIPILDGDIAEFAQKLKEVVIEYDQDPSRLDKLRHHASRYIANRYNPKSMRSTLLSAWKEIEKIVSS